MTDVTTIVNEVYQRGGTFILSREDGSFHLESMNAMPDELLLKVEQNKEAIYQALGGKGQLDTYDAPSQLENDVKKMKSVLKGLSNILKERGLEVLPQDQVSKETLNRHYYHFSNKFDAVAESFSQL